MRVSKSACRIVVIVLVIIVIIIPSIYSHVPKTSKNNYDLENAKHVHDPTKSWVIYSELKNEEKAHYYEVKLEEDERLKCSILIPEDNNFTPDIIIMGPHFDNSSDIPDHIEVPSNYGYILIKGKKVDREYEPFTPASYYYPAEYDDKVNKSSTYYVVVTSNNTHGKYGLAIGYEERYGMIEWIKVPIDVINIHIWEGQSILLIFSPLIITSILGVIYFLWAVKNSGSTPNYLGGWFTSIAGLAYIGTGGMMLLQMILASMKADPGPGIVVTILFTIIPLSLGIFTLSLGLKMKPPIDLKEKAKLGVVSILALVIWAGLIIGPVIALIGAVLPLKNKKG